jgi:hypothetical protein
MSAETIQNEVIEELSGNVRIVPPDDFFDKILRAAHDTGPIVSQVKKQYYDAKPKRWKGFPEPGGHVKECDLYMPLVKIANATNMACSRQQANPVQGQWLDTHSVAPASRNEDRPAIEPDIVYVSRQNDARKLQEKLRKHMDEDVDPEEDSPNLSKDAVRSIFWR